MAFSPAAVAILRLMDKMNEELYICPFNRRAQVGKLKVPVGSALVLSQSPYVDRTSKHKKTFKVNAKGKALLKD